MTSPSSLSPVVGGDAEAAAAAEAGGGSAVSAEALAVCVWKWKTLEWQVTCSRRIRNRCCLRCCRWLMRGSPFHVPSTDPPAWRSAELTAQTQRRLRRQRRSVRRGCPRVARHLKRREPPPPPPPRRQRSPAAMASSLAS